MLPLPLLSLTLTLLAPLTLASPWGTPTTAPPTATTTVTITSTSTATSVSQCDASGGSAVCCDTVESASSPSAKSILGLLGIVIEDVGELVGLDCDAITIAGAGATCNQEAVCCENNTFKGVIAIGCVPITIDL